MNIASVFSQMLVQYTTCCSQLIYRALAHEENNEKHVAEWKRFQFDDEWMDYFKVTKQLICFALRWSEVQFIKWIL